MKTSAYRVHRDYGASVKVHPQQHPRVRSGEPANAQTSFSFIFWFAAHALQWDGHQGLASQGAEQVKDSQGRVKRRRGKSCSKRFFPCAAWLEAGEGGRGMWNKKKKQSFLEKKQSYALGSPPPPLWLSTSTRQSSPSESSPPPFLTPHKVSLFY